jgi:hypothetical protein
MFGKKSLGGGMKNQARTRAGAPAAKPAAPGYGKVPAVAAKATGGMMKNMQRRLGKK